MRKIIHVDMDAFFASVEQYDNPSLRGKAIAVGGGENRGVVAAASYEARKFGVRSAMSGKTAKQKCPHLIFVRPHFERYREVSGLVMGIFHEFTDLVQPMSLDEAYLDVTENKVGNIYAAKIAKSIKQKIFDITGLTASAGVSFNKFLAKIASDMNKPDGLKVILPGDAQALLDKLPIEKFHGIGEKTAERMRKHGIHTGLDIRAHELDFLEKHFGKAGTFYYHIVRCIDYREVKTDWVRKSLGAEETFDSDIIEPDDLIAQLSVIAKTVAHRLEKRELKGHTLTLKIKYHDFELKTRSKTFTEWVNEAEELLEHAVALLYNPELPHKPVRLLGISISNLNIEEQTPPQLSLSVAFDLQLKLPFSDLFLRDSTQAALPNPHNPNR
ncbi:MAG: DNA polymerase IV [Bacteroidota bacterium]|nr:DNA polymerase IV [Bacteroidota bacterium]